MFALHTLFPTKKKKKIIIDVFIKRQYPSHDENCVPLLSQPKLLDPKHPPHLLSQSLRPLKLIKVVPNHGGATRNAFVQGFNLLSEALDVLNLLSAQVFQCEELFVQLLQLSLMSRSPSYQVLTDVIVAPRSRAGLYARPEIAIHDLFDLRYRRRVQTGGFTDWISRDAQGIHQMRGPFPSGA
jgi:hypothetical protein